METQHIQIKKIITETTGTRKLKKILLIDEDKDSALSTTLEQKGYDLIHCDSVQKAWGLVYPHRPQLIVLHLYDTNRLGLSNLQECRALAERIPIILAAPAKVNQRRSKPRSTERRSFLPLRRCRRASQKRSNIWRSRR